MARLKVRLRGKTLSDIPLSEEKTYTAGRKEDADICLQGDKGISREHFKLSSNNGVWTVESISRFGEILIGGEKAENIPLEHGMTFAVPPYEFEFLMTSADAGSGAPGGAKAGGPFEADVNAMIGEEFVPEKTFVGIAPSVPYIKVMDTQGEPKELIRLEGGDSWLAGREPTCNIQIRDQRVSRRQFEVRKSGSQYYIIDLGSVNGTLVNGNPISTNDLTPLKSGDAITVLENYLYFELHDPNFKSRMEMVSLQPATPLIDLSSSENPPPVPFSSHLIHVPEPGQSLPAVPGYHTPANFDPYGNQMPPALSFPTQESSGNPLFDKKNRVKVIIGVLAIGFVAFTLLEDKESDVPVAHQVVSNDPFTKLTPEQKKLVKDTLQLAKSYYMQGKYELSKSELVKMTEFIPEYEDSKKLFQLAEEAIYVQQEQRRQEEMARNQKEQEEKIQAKAQACRAKMTPDMTRDQMELCLEEVMAFNPGHPLFEELFGVIANRQAEIAAKAAGDAAHEAEVARLKGIYAKAKALDVANKPLSAIKAYEGVIAARLPDPGGLKAVSTRRIAEIKKMINAKTEAMQKESEKLAHDGKLRDAIVALRAAKQVDPQNPLLDEKIETYKLKLQEEMMRYYQEGILDESFGNVDGDENKPGAKQKWRKILQNDIEDGEYYKKAYIKMKKYGVPK